MKLSTVKKLINIEPKLAMLLALIVCSCYYMGHTFAAIILTIILVLIVISYFVLALVYWRCPYCHQYLPTKNAGRLRKCPHCHKLIHDEKVKS